MENKSSTCHMTSEKRLIDANALLAYINNHDYELVSRMGCVDKGMFTDGIEHGINIQPTVDAVEVVHGRWERCGGDLHSSGYAVYCSVCNKTHFVHKEYSLGGLYGHKELFELPNYCPHCGAKMDGGNEDA